jgi:hypothetical protein
MAQVAGATNARKAAHMGQLSRVSSPLLTASGQDHSPLHQLERSSRVRNRMLESGTSGSVGGEGGNLLAYPANSPYGMIGGIEERSSRQGRSLAGCKSPYRQLPVVGRLAYPIRGEVTTRVLLGRKSPGCPAGVRSGRDDLGGEQTWRPERNEISATSKIPPHEVVSSGILREADPLFLWGRPMAPWKKQARAHGVPPG